MRGIIRFHGHLLHYRPHADEIFSIWLLERFDRSGRFRGEPIGCLGSRFDEHPILSGNRQKKCAAVLVAEALEVKNQPAVKDMLDYIQQEDENGEDRAFLLARMFKVITEMHPDDLEGAYRWLCAVFDAEAIVKEGAGLPAPSIELPEIGLDWIIGKFPDAEIPEGKDPTEQLKKLYEAASLEEDFRISPIIAYAVSGGNGHPYELANLVSLVSRAFPGKSAGIGEWTRIFLDTYLARQNKLWNEARLEYEELKQVGKAEELQIKGPTQNLKLVIVDGSNSPQMMSYGRSKKGAGARILVLRTPRGNIQIFGRRYLSAMFDRIAVKLRIRECQEDGRDAEKIRSLLAAEKVPGDRWCYLRGGGVPMLLNGSLTHPEVPPTRLSLATIKQIIIEAGEEARRAERRKKKANQPKPSPAA